MAAVIEKPLEQKKARVEEANVLIEGLDEVTRKAVYIATKMFLAQRDTADSVERSLLENDRRKKANREGENTE